MEALIIVMSLVSWLALCGVAASIASKKGRSGEGVFFLSLLLSPLVGLIVAATMEPNLAAQGKKKCPNCAEFVQPDARVCRFCQHSFVEEQMEAARLQAERQAQLLEEANKQEAARLAAAAEEAKKPWLRRNLAIVVFVVVAVTFPTAVLRFISLVDPTKSPAIKRTEPQACMRPANAMVDRPGNR